MQRELIYRLSSFEVCGTRDPLRLQEIVSPWMWRTSSRDQKEEGAFVYFVQPFRSCFCCYMMMGLYFTHQLMERAEWTETKQGRSAHPGAAITHTGRLLTG